MKNTWFAFYVLITCSSLLIGIAHGQSVNGPFGGSVGTLITFLAQNVGCGFIGDPHYTEYWDFGPGATPANVTIAGIWDGSASVNFPQVVVTYSTPGVKTLTVNLDSSGIPYTPQTYPLHIFDCSIPPSIPHDAIVINSDTTVTYYNQDTAKTYWVNTGVRFNLSNLSGYGDSILTIFAEPGSTIYGGGFNVFYMKGSSVLNAPGVANSVIFGDRASINTGTSSSDFTLNCPTLDFDYSNAPPNPAFASASVKNDLASISLTLSPNPTGGMLSVQGLPLDNITVSVFNTLGETVMEQKNPQSPDLTLDLSKLVPGTYYIRFSSANSVATKAIIKN